MHILALMLLQWVVLNQLLHTTSALSRGMKKMNLTFYINNNLNYYVAELERLDLDNSDLENRVIE